MLHRLVDGGHSVVSDSSTRSLDVIAVSRLGAGPAAGGDGGRAVGDGGDAWEGRGGEREPYWFTGAICARAKLTP